MNSESLQLFFAKNGFTVAEQEDLLSFFKPQAYEKGACFVEEGQRNQFLGFIESGIFQYFFNLDGEEITTYVTSKGGFVASLLSFLQNVPSRETIRAITEGQLWLIHKNEVRELCKRMEKFQQFYVNLLEYQIVCIDNSRFDLITLNAEQRYEKILREEPHLLQDVPLQYLASTLGVTPRHLSRIRKNIRL